MYQSKLLIPTLRETPADLKADGHQLLVRAGFIRQFASGVYGYLPLALKVLEKIEGIIKEELENLGAVEMNLPHLIPVELLEKTGRKEMFKDNLFQLKDRSDRGFVLSPTSEELFASLVFDDHLSYKRFPFYLYQIQSKFRDESKVRHGLFQGREFLMADCYSFHTSKESLKETYHLFEEAFQKIFARLNIRAVSVLGENFYMGGSSDSREFVALSNVGDEIIFQSSLGDYVASQTMAKSYLPEKRGHGALKPLEKIKISPEELPEFLEKLPEMPQKITAYGYLLGEKKAQVLLLDASTLNEGKVRRFFTENYPNTPFEKDSSASFVSPILKDELIFADEKVLQVTNGLYLGNEKDTYYLNGNIGRDFVLTGSGDFTLVNAGDLAPDGQGILEELRGVEIAHLFKLDDFYADALQGDFLDEEGQKQKILMGSYGIGVSRILQVIAQQHYDDKGLVWPKEVAPFDLHLIPVNLNDEFQMKLLSQVEEMLQTTPYSYLIDDRNEHVGVKFADSELIGCPIRLVIGKKAEEGIVEVTLRKSGEKVEVKKEDLVDILPILF